MRLRRILILTLVLALLAGAGFAVGAAGGKDDPLISRAYADGSFAAGVRSDAKKAISYTLQPLYDRAVAALGGEGGSTGAFTVKSVSAGSTAALELGDSVILLSGAASLSIGQGSVVNVTTGTEAASGALVRDNRYLACEDSRATVTFSQASTVAVDGSVTFTGSVSPFTDVTASSWFYSDVVTAVDKGLISGKTATTYEPKSSLTVAEAIKLAACLHQLHSRGSVTLTNSPTAPWYQSYVDYAVAQGIIEGAYSDYNTAVTRSAFVHIFYHALPASGYTAVNSIADGAVPDVAMTDAYAAEIYAFYRAGIVTGYASTPGYAEHAFGANTTIARSEVAAILTRMYDSTARKSFSIG